MADGEELLVPGEDELHRPPRGARERGDVRLEVEVALRSEAAAEERHDDADVGLRNPERVRDPGARDVRHLGRRPDGHPIALPLRHDRARLDRHALRRVGDVAAADHDVGRLECRVHVALHDRGEAEQVVVAAEHVGAVVGLPVRVHERRVVAERGREVGHHLERLELDLDERGCGTRDLGRGRRDPGHDVALEADGVAREEPPVLHHAAVEEVGDVLVRHDGDHARECARLRGVDPRDPRVRMVGVAERRVELAREREVGRVPARARHLLLPVGPDEALGALLDGGHGAIQPRRARPREGATVKRRDPVVQARLVRARIPSPGDA